MIGPGFAAAVGARDAFKLLIALCVVFGFGVAIGFALGSLNP